MSQTEIAIIGGGYTGMSAALNLLKKGHKVTIYEGSNSLGGLAGCIKVGQNKIERFYHHFFLSDTRLLDLALELNIADQIVWLKPETAIYYNQRFYHLKSALDLLAFSPIPFLERLRMGWLILQSGRSDGYEKLDDISAKEWIESKVGKIAYQVLWQPLLYSKFGKSADSISAAWLWAKFRLRGLSRNKKGQEVLGYFKDGGFANLTQALSETLNARGVKLELGSIVSEIKEESGGWQVKTLNFTRRYDKVIATIAPPILANMLKTEDLKLIGRLKEVYYQANICLLIESKESISPYYWVSVEDINCPFVAIIEHTNFMAPRDYGDHHILYLSRYLNQDDELYKKSDEEVRETFFEYLKQIFPDFKEEQVIKVTTSRAKYTQPIVLTGQSKRLLPLASPLKNFYIASMSQIFPEDRGVNYALDIGNRVAEIAMKGR